MSEMCALDAQAFELTERLLMSCVCCGHHTSMPLTLPLTWGSSLMPRSGAAQQFVS